MLITGATGCVGQALARLARDGGWRVRGVARRPPTSALALDEFVTAPIEDLRSIAEAARGCHAVVHLASWVHRVPRTASEQLELRRSIVDGTENVASAAKSAGARLVFLSSVAVYGTSGDIAATERTPPSPETPYARAKLEAERVARDLVPESTIIRSTLVYGPHDRGNFAALIRAVDQSRAFIVGSGGNQKSLVYTDNLGDRILRALDLEPASVAGVWIAADEPSPTQRELVQAIARALDRPAPPGLPAALVGLGAWVVDGVAPLVLGRETAYRDKARKLAQVTGFSGAALDRLLGYRPRVELSEGVRRAVQWYRNHDTHT
jgi:nucleoside-diphosphate-sugar epimerase